MEKLIQPCRNCTEREQGCHCHCEKYKKWKIAFDERKKTIEEAKKNYYPISGYDINKIGIRKIKR